MGPFHVRMPVSNYRVCKNLGTPYHGDKGKWLNCKCMFLKLIYLLCQRVLDNTRLMLYPCSMQGLHLQQFWMKVMSFIFLDSLKNWLFSFSYKWFELVCTYWWQSYIYWLTRYIFWYVSSALCVWTFFYDTISFVVWQILTSFICKHCTWSFGCYTALTRLLRGQLIPSKVIWQQGGTRYEWVS